MYSDEILEELDDHGIDIGDRVRIGDREGRLMPKPESGDPQVYVLKLDSGYNIGIEGEIELIEKASSEERERTIEHAEEKPDIIVLHTGGTIASRVSYEEGGVKPAFEPEDLVEMYPELAEEVNLHSDVIAQMVSEDMEPGHWQDIAEEIDRVKDDYDGIIVGHGTDTMAYTGAALSFMLQSIDTGVMLVGAQRSSDRPSSDAAMNLYCAAKFLVETDFNGVGVCMHASSNDTSCAILPATKARKMHTSRRDAFKPVNSEVWGTVNYETGEIEKNYENPEGEYNPRFDLDNNIGYIKARPGMTPEEIEFLGKQDYSGVIIEGTGLGHLPATAFDEKTEHHEEMLEKLSELSEDAVVAMTSQCIHGRIDMNVYGPGLKIQEAGVISAEDMHPELAYVKLMWALGNSSSREEAVELFHKNVAGELQARSIYSD